MIATWIGQAGSILVNTAFVAALLATIGFILSAKAAHQQQEQEAKSWLRFARFSFFGHAAAVLGVVGMLYIMISGHYYEYQYAHAHASRNLPTHYIISSFWEGQEGSFLLWIFWHVCIGFLLMKKAGKQWQAPVLATLSLVQVFLLSMVLGVVFFDVFKIGSSPFLLLRDTSPLPVFAINPNFVPEDGTGLNPLLQNYWMVIHPPTLFLGFALTLVPFAFCMAGLATGRFTEWVKPALAWSHVAAVVLGTGIMMGAYWAYETLNFGGYWNWDPVENAVYIPWLVLLAGIHALLIYRKNATAFTTGTVLVVASFVLVLYSTFLVRSGVLGNSSVHAFTDLGLSGQLIFFMLFFLFVSASLLIRSWKYLPKSEKEISVYNSEFWLFIGITTLCLTAFQVLVPTSFPVYNSILALFGINSNLAPPADQVTFYSNAQLWFAVAIAIISGIGLFFYWNRMNKERVKEVMSLPLIVALLLSALLVSLGNITEPAYMALLTAAVFSLVASGTIIFNMLKRGLKLSAGAVTHMGLAIMLLGILYSSGYSRVVSTNYSGRVYNAEFPEEVNRDNLLLFRNQPKQMEEFKLTYKGPRVESEQVPGLIDKELLLKTPDLYKSIVKEDLAVGGKLYAKRGDTIQVYGENTFYEVEFAYPDGSKKLLYPRVQDNPDMGLAYSPDVLKSWDRDLYTHLSTLAVDDADTDWKGPEEFNLAAGDTLILNDFIGILESLERVENLLEIDLEEGDVAVRAKLRVFGFDEVYKLEPVLLVRGNSLGSLAAINRDLGVKLTFDTIDPTTGKAKLSLYTTQRDWVILKAVEKPFINLLWIGVIIMIIGFTMAAINRFKAAPKETPKPKAVRQPKVYA